MGTLEDFTALLAALAPSKHSNHTNGTDPADASGEMARRTAVGRSLMELLNADFFVSCRLGPHASYTHPVWINMSEPNMRRYEHHFQFHDPLTPRMRAAGRACRVEDRVPSRALHATEFHRDFLAVDGLARGMNYFPAHSVHGTVDLRLWRAEGAVPFSDAEVALLQSAGDLVQLVFPAGSVAGPAASSGARFAVGAAAPMPLTPRESEVAHAVARGLSDRVACRELGCSMGTLRTHLSRVFAKLGVGSRGELIALLAASTR